MTGVSVRELGKGSARRKRRTPTESTTTPEFEIPNPDEPRVIAKLHLRTLLDHFIRNLDSVPCLVQLLEKTGYTVKSIGDERGPGVVGFACPQCGTNTVSATGNPAVRIRGGTYGLSLNPQRLYCLACDKWSATASTVAPIVLRGDDA